MDLVFGLPSLFLLLTGGFGVSVWNAVARRDGPSALAMAMAGLGTAHLTGLPTPLLVWGCTIFTIAIVMSLAGLLLRLIAGCDAFRVGMIGTIATALLLLGHQARSLPSSTAVLGDQSLALGSQLHQQILGLVRGSAG
jgi:hypothetical protein